MNDPHGARVDVRLAHYSNSATEAAAIKAVDEQVFDRVRAFERILTGNARACEERAKLARERAMEAAADLSAFIRALEGREVELNEDAALRYESLRGRGRQEAAELRRAMREVDFHVQRASDPYGEYVKLIKKYPALGR